MNRQSGMGGTVGERDPIRKSAVGMTKVMGWQNRHKEQRQINRQGCFNGPIKSGRQGSRYPIHMVYYTQTGSAKLLVANEYLAFKNYGV